ncbi:MAG: hypothetical protein DCC55_27900 [Chloroflexi bacterium]|nr:MAG: hypothetical protein DCC55_27900 [Chloroflexota bacterium]
MPTVFEKLNLKNQDQIVVLNAPPSFEDELANLANVSVIRDIDAVSELSFSLAFVTKQDELNTIAAGVTAKAKGDTVVWFAYPKGSSKRYKCEFNRDSGWTVLGAAGFEPVRQVAIDEDWSALRFRRVEFIKSMKRDPSRASSIEGKKRTSAR